MKHLAEFEIFEIFSIKIGLALTGRLIAGGPISNDKDILQKDVYISFRYNEREILKKIICLDGRFGRVGQDIVAEKGDNIALLVERDSEAEDLIGINLPQPIIGEVVAK